jgi:murein DD-endopeptidase MepM/ murein hydrolase activator NlpD
MLRRVMLGVLLLSAACTPVASLSTPSTQALPTQLANTLPAPTEKAQEAPTFTLSPTSSPLPPTSAPTQVTELTICSPLEGISLDELVQPDLLKNPFDPPRPGMDDGHHGADFAYWSRGERKTMLGLPILSALSGRVAGVILDREPYGYAVIIETPLEAFPASLPQNVRLPTPAPTIQPASNLFCPAGSLIFPTTTQRSLYLLYAHMSQPPAVSIGEQVACGQVIGEVGTTGKSVNPHLHLETRSGPSGSIFPVMAHYENDATTEEMQAYCTWRVSGLFQMFDPLWLLKPKTLQP